MLHPVRVIALGEVCARVRPAALGAGDRPGDHGVREIQLIGIVYKYRHTIDRRTTPRRRQESRGSAHCSALAGRFHRRARGLRLVELALAIGALGALVALVPVDLMEMITNALYFG